MNAFVSMKEEIEDEFDEEFDLDPFKKQIDELKDEFEKRFKDFAEIEDIVAYIAYPFRGMEPEEMSLLAEKISHLIDGDSRSVTDEIFKIKCDIALKAPAIHTSGN
uniref:Uncharacterized protein n=1 Tax=Cacopsylla melanoneura TaxID=428564 RepID=A0A8D8M6D6_9HEMI